MAEVDTSSYPKPPALPVQKSALEQVGQYQQLQQGQQAIQSSAIGIDSQKLKLVNERFGLINKELSTLIATPNISKEDAAKRLTTFANTYKLPADVQQHMLGELNAAPNVKSFAQNALTRGQTTQEAINFHYGEPGFANNGQQQVPVKTSPKFGIQRLDNGAINQPIQQQVPPTTAVINPKNPSGPTVLQGPQPEVPTPGLPIKQNAIPGPSTNFGGTVTGASVEPPGLPIKDFNNRFAGGPTGPAVAQGPGVAEAENQAGAASGVQLSHAREKSANFQREIYPLAQAIPSLEKLGTKGTGPGTETISNIKSFILSNVPGISEKDPQFKNIKTYDEARKYLTDVVNQLGNTGTNDKLAAAFAGNPSVHISNAAAQDVAKSIYALRRMQQAIHLEFEASNKPASQYSKWIANRTNDIDPRAFGVDLMKPEAKAKLLEELNKNPVEKKRFDKSLQLAIDSKFLTSSSK